MIVTTALYCLQVQGLLKLSCYKKWWLLRLPYTVQLREMVVVTTALYCLQVQGLVKLSCYEKCIFTFHYATCWKEYRGRFSADKISDKVGG